MKHLTTGLLWILSFSLCLSPAVAQDKASDIPANEKTEILKNFRYFDFGFYIDTYLNIELDRNRDTAGIVPFSANCPATNQFRLNVAALEAFYNNDKVRGTLQIQFGDAPNLLADLQKQWIKNIRQAKFGFRIGKKNWIDMGYMFTPVGVESSWPVVNSLSSVTMCGYFEPGSYLGLKFTRNFSEKVSGGFMVGNPYSLAYQQTDHLTGVLFINYTPIKNLTVSYNNIFGNQALRNAELNNNLLYNDILITYDPLPWINLTGQFDFAFQTNSARAPDTTKIASMCSGFVQGKISFLKYFSFTGRYEYYYDPEGFLSGTYTYNEKTTGLTTQGFSAGLEFKPVSFSYLRAEYKFMQANPGNKVFYSGSSDRLQALIFTAGVRF